MADPHPYSPERIADRMAIQDVMYRWCRAIDRLDAAGMRAVYHPGATDDHGPYKGTAEGLVDWVIERHRNIPFSSHGVLNMLIEFASPDVALVETYVRTLQRYPAEAKAELAQLSGGAAGDAGQGMDLMTASRYVDRFERRQGEWRIAARTLIQDWKQLLVVAPGAPAPRADWIVGRRDGADYVQTARAALGIA